MEIEKTQFELAEYGILKLEKNQNGFEWFGHVNIPISKTPLDLTIEVKNQNVPSNEQIGLIEEFGTRWQTTSLKLFEYMEECFRNSKWETDKNELQKMYFLSAIGLKRNNSEWEIVLEPEFDVTSIFNFLLRFTLKNNEIIWSNL
ncbi:hypothetical protein KMW28_05525 [Flammeovirga yaeyamensis]|uniref:Uncharacterized protein n=1 Tax=Flammeovirga yaeyamensis TaxID=367791 RepID=A0AAX1N6I5_9BACT|nr:hypothetical protein [Flammeovirga yaeyamensis]MBB3697625.1 hypothetical protein [Flammeovirga yaeyamensis]NMF36315.1 hypothetical protein [Flammeovirga yaeyamensis]QWG03042.1 hypothetical protein KMW28_05525 [Flammeovirga yaeyamensis]